VQRLPESEFAETELEERLVVSNDGGDE
jgi:hypothetical protein